jgi:hypothetical protein
MRQIQDENFPRNSSMASFSLASLSRPARLATRLCQRQAVHRCLSSTAPRAAEVEDGDTSVQSEPAAADGPAVAAADSFKEFLQTIAVPYREARPTNWLSQTVSLAGFSRN